MEDLREFENKLYKEGYQFIGGVDEVGRGPLVGPVVAACCVLSKDFVLEGLTDSKKLSEKKRDLFAAYIKEHAIAYGIGIISPEKIDEINIYEASREAMKEAIRKVRTKVNMDYVLTDAMPINLDIPVAELPFLPISFAEVNIFSKLPNSFSYSADISSSVKLPPPKRFCSL